MSLDTAQLATFRSRFEAKEPDPKNFVRKVTKFDFYLTVEDLVEERRSKGYAWEGIAEDFAALGVVMKLSTLKTCFRRARLRKRCATAGSRRPARPGHPIRRARSGTSSPALNPQTEPPQTGEADEVTTLDPPTSDARVESVPNAVPAPAPDEPTVAPPTRAVDPPDLAPSGRLEPANAEEVPDGGREEMLAAPPTRADPNAGAVGSPAPDQPAPRRVYRSTITIRPEKPLSAFKENT